MRKVTSKTIFLTPTHKQELSHTEITRIRISQISNKFIEHAFILPNSVNNYFFNQHFPKSKMIHLEDEYFRTIRDYNRLLLTNNFYDMFNSYEYIVILQTDSFLIKDISDIIDKKFTYVGSPWAHPKKINFLFGHFYENSRKINGFLSTKIEVGNGGLSIRKVSNFIDLLSSIRYKNNKNSHIFSGLYNEDLVFSYFFKRNGFKIPTALEARRWFSEELSRNLDLNTALGLYGFHALGKFNPDLEAALLKCKNN